jgi:hypothetical protein
MTTRRWADGSKPQSWPAHFLHVQRRAAALGVSHGRRGGALGGVRPPTGRRSSSAQHGATGCRAAADCRAAARCWLARRAAARRRRAAAVSLLFSHGAWFSAVLQRRRLGDAHDHARRRHPAAAGRWRCGICPLARPAAWHSRGPARWLRAWGTRAARSSAHMLFCARVCGGVRLGAARAQLARTLRAARARRPAATRRGPRDRRGAPACLARATEERDTHDALLLRS